MGQLILFTIGYAWNFHIGIPRYTYHQHLLCCWIHTGYHIHVAPTRFIHVTIDVHATQKYDERLFCNRKIRNIFHINFRFHTEIINNLYFLYKSRIILLNQLIQRLIINHRANLTTI